ncbi:LPS-assembly protein LptD [Desulfocicer vacuolatum]|nr:LPS assembly protein LptD [Desulfocicer vacuolatum]
MGVLPCQIQALPLRAPGNSWHISAEKATYDPSRNLYTAQGEVVLTGETARITADHILYNNLTKDARATGHVTLMSGKDTIHCDAMHLNLETETGTIMNGIIFVEENNFYISGDHIKKTGKNTYSADKASLTSCAGENPDWKITGRDIHVTIEGYGMVKHATLWAGNLPALYTPFMAFPVKNKRQTGLLSPNITHSDRKGIEYEQPLFLALNRSSDATFYVDYMSDRGIKLGAEYRYMQDNNNKGTLFFDYLKDDKIDDGTDATSHYAYDSTPQRTNRNRYWFRMKNDREIFPHWQARLDVDYVSDGDYLHEFKKGYTGLTATDKAFESTFGRDLDDYDDTTRKNQLNIKRAWDRYNLNMDVLWYDNVTARRQNTDDTTLQSLPSITFRGMRQKLGQSPFYFDLNSSYTSFFRQDTTNTLITGQRMDLYPRIYYPFHINGFRLTPSLGGRHTAWYTHDAADINETRNGYSHRELFDINLDLSTVFTRIFSIDNAANQKIRHQITPALAYSFIPHVDQTDIPQFDDIDLIDKENTLTWQLTQRLTSKRQINPSDSNTPAFAYRELAWLKMSQTYYLSGRDEDTQKNFSNILLDLELSPMPHVYLNSDMEWSPYGTGIFSHNSAITVKDDKQNRIRLQYRYSREDPDENEEETESIYTGVNVGLTPRLRGFLEYEKNLYEDETIETTTGIELDRDCWSMKLSYTKTSDDSAMGFLINLKGLGEFGNP